MGFIPNMTYSNLKSHKMVNNSSSPLGHSSPFNVARARMMQNMTPEIIRQRKRPSKLLDPINVNTPNRKHSNIDEIDYLKKQVSSLIAKLGISKVMKDPEKVAMFDEAISQNTLLRGGRSRMSNNKSFDNIEQNEPNKLNMTTPPTLNIKDQISKFQHKIHSHKQNKQISPVTQPYSIKIDEQKEPVQEEVQDRWKVEKCEKGASWKKRFQMMYRAKMMKLDKKIKTTPAYQDYRSIMKADSIMGRRRVLHSIYDTIDESFKGKESSLDKDLVKTDKFIASLSKLTQKFSSKLFLKKPLELMLKHFEDPAWNEESDDEDLFPLLMGGKRSRRKNNNNYANKNLNSRARNSAQKSSQRKRKNSETPYLMSETTQHLEIEEKSPRKRSHQLLFPVKTKDQLLPELTFSKIPRNEHLNASSIININIKPKRRMSRF
ncbi:unnamed protein product [Moneuplotes crassus]|uniref:Uncharacterized protein n=1 Tax=Euplotes crassus TaxID=5936 RepID=A0AAD1UP27_EUPCR|nr:unnamed protein product [Moneuplotes crassus]